MQYSTLEDNTAKLVSHLYRSPHREEYPYHNLAHTINVVDHVKEIAAFYSLDEKQTRILILSAWFHDTGQLYGEMNGHEERSVMIMKNYLDTLSAPIEIIRQAEICILATRSGAVAGS